MKKRKSQKELDINENSISRRGAMKRIGIAAFSGATMLLLLNQPGKAQENDTSDTEGFPGDPGDF